ncbi:MAG: hypothetical protein RLZZ532_4293, partial [Cyanobacteriota bacterium]
EQASSAQSSKAGDDSVIDADFSETI